ncbi:hypothetical protein OROMI_025123 [Orobanche minor]
MCGIALIICGIKIDLSSLVPNFNCSSTQCHLHLPFFSEDDIKEALQRRGPDSLGAHVINLCSEISHDERKDFIVQSSDLTDRVKYMEVFILAVIAMTQRFLCGLWVSVAHVFPMVKVNLLPVLEKIKIHTGTFVKNQWAMGFDLLDSTKTLWFGRDAFGRRSLLVHWPTHQDPRLLLSSVSPLSSTQKHYVIDGKGKVELNFWEELSCGVYSISMSPIKTNGRLIGEIMKHEWTDSELKDLITWDRTFIEPKPEHLSVCFRKVQIEQQDTFSDFESQLRSIKSTPLATSHKVLMALRESVMRRTALNRIYQDFLGNYRQHRDVPIAVLFSGGLDSMIIAALLHQCIDSEYDIDLLNVSFDGELAPDRISGRAGLKELQKIVPSRRWNLVEIDADLLKLTFETKHVMALIDPAKTYMDLNIGIALWLAAGGDGWLYDETRVVPHAQHQRVKYKSKARILLVGSGADEQCAGYGRHRTKFRNRSWLGLHEEMKLDMQRIWKRNLGRDDRCIADNAKEARFPFLDEDVIRTLLDIPLWEIADLNQPSGIGDKKILREVARLLCLNEAATLPKRAIQFGSRVARESNMKNFGSNRAANQASAGSVVIHDDFGCLGRK